MTVKRATNYMILAYGQKQNSRQYLKPKLESKEAEHSPKRDWEEAAGGKGEG